MFQRAEGPNFAARMFLSALALTFAITATLQGFLAASTSEWWPAVVAAVFGSAALWCLAAVLRYRRHGIRNTQPHPGPSVPGERPDRTHTGEAGR